MNLIQQTKAKARLGECCLKAQREPVHIKQTWQAGGGAWFAAEDFVQQRKS